MNFTDTSIGSPTAWAWSFGDGSTSTVQSPTHSYTTPGIYTITLIASNAGGSDPKVNSNCITVCDPAATQLVYPTSYGYDTNNVTYTSGTVSDLQPDDGKNMVFQSKGGATYGAFSAYFEGTTTHTAGEIQALRYEAQLHSSATGGPDPMIFACNFPKWASQVWAWESGANGSTLTASDQWMSTTVLDMSKYLGTSSPNLRVGVCACYHAATSGYPVYFNAVRARIFLKPTATVAPVADLAAGPTRGVYPLDGPLLRRLGQLADFLVVELRRRRQQHGAKPQPYLRRRRVLHSHPHRDEQLWQ